MFRLVSALLILVTTLGAAPHARAHAVGGEGSPVGKVDHRHGRDPSTQTARLRDHALRFRGDHDYPPFEFLDADGRPRGFNVDVARAVAEALDIDVDISLGRWADVRRQLENGEIDALTGMFWTAARDSVVDFTAPHLTVSYAVFVRPDSPIRSLDDVVGRQIVVQAQDLGHDFVLEHHLTRDLVLCDDWEDVLRTLARGTGDCAIVSRLQGMRQLSEPGLEGLQVVGSPFQQRKYGFAVREGDTVLRAALDEGLAILHATGAYDRIYERWFGSQEPAAITPVALLKYLAPLVGVVLMTLAWSWSLRRQVRARTAELERELRERRRAEDALRERLEFESVVAEFAATLARWPAGATDRDVRHAVHRVMAFLDVDVSGFLEVLADRDELELIHATAAGDSDRQLAIGSPASYRWLARRLRRGHDVVAETLPRRWPAAARAERDLARELGLGSVIALPIVRADAVIAAVALGTTGRTRTWSPDVIRRARLVGEVLAGMIARRRADTEKQQLQLQLLQAQKMEAIGALAGGIAHDFNNVLGAIMGYTGLARDSLPPDAPAQRDLTAVLGAAQRAAGLVQQILAFSRSRDQVREPVEVQTIVREALAMLRPTLPSTLEIRDRLADEPLHVVADPGQIHQVIMNLCTNAYHAMPGGSGILEVNVAAGAAGRDEVVLEVADTGTGMSREVVRRCFEPFFTTKSVGRGTGMGLAVVYGIVTDLGGRIDVDSTPGVGTRFTIVLPRSRDRLDPAATAALGVDEGIDPARNGTERIFLVDDEPLLTRLAARQLGRLGYRTTTFEDAAAALAALARDPHACDLLITDQTMPGLTGDALVRRARRLRPDLPFIVCTGHSESLDPDLVRTLGGSELLLKPYDGPTLARAIRRALDGIPA